MIWLDPTGIFSTHLMIQFITRSDILLEFKHLLLFDLLLALTVSTASSLLFLCSFDVCSSGRINSSAVLGRPGYKNTSNCSSGTPDTCTDRITQACITLPLRNSVWTAASLENKVKLSELTVTLQTLDISFYLNSH